MRDPHLKQATAASQKLGKTPLRLPTRAPDAPAPTPETSGAPTRFASYRTLLENLWFAAKQPKPAGGIAIVIAGANEGIDVAEVVEGLNVTASSQGMSAAMGYVVWEEGEPRIVLAHATSPGTADERRSAEIPRFSPPLACMKSVSEGDPENAAWLAKVLQCVDVLTVVGPSLDRSPGAAQVAALCDGLVLVIEGDSTTKDDLSAASARARAVGCRLLGVVVQVKRRRMGRWTRPFSLWKRGR